MNSTFAGTPGPFTILRDPNQSTQVEGFCTINPVDGPPTAYVASLADANLYAGAEELLESLVIAPKYSDYVTVWAFVGAYENWYNKMAKAAIAKALGQV